MGTTRWACQYPRQVGLRVAGQARPALTRDRTSRLSSRSGAPRRASRGRVGRLPSRRAPRELPTRGRRRGRRGGRTTAGPQRVGTGARSPVATVPLMIIVRLVDEVAIPGNAETLVKPKSARDDSRIPIRACPSAAASAHLIYHVKRAPPMSTFAAQRCAFPVRYAWRAPRVSRPAVPRADSRSRCYPQRNIQHHLTRPNAPSSSQVPARIRLAPFPARRPRRIQSGRVRDRG